MSLSQSPHACTTRLICCPTKGLCLCPPNRDPCAQRRAPRICTHPHNGARCTLATCVAPRDADTTSQSRAKCSHLDRLGVLASCLVAAAPRRRCPLPNPRIPLLADRNISVAREYGCLIEDKEITFRAGKLIGPKGVLRQITMNDLPVGRSVDEALRFVQAFQFSVSDL